MAGGVMQVKNTDVKTNKKHSIGVNWYTIVKQKELIFMSVPFLLYILLFAYVPVWGWLMAFQNYKSRPGTNLLNLPFKQEWVGLKWFQFLFSDSSFLRVLRNTLAMSLINLILGFSTAILLALLLNELKNIFFKRVVQTISYLPHFLSWIIATGIIMDSLSTENGIINIVLVKLHIIAKPIIFLAEPKYFWGIVGLSGVWKEVGWNTIIYLAAITAIDPSLYEAASIDGCGRFRKMLNITLPGIKATFFILLLMNIGNILNAGFEVQYLLGNNGLLTDVSQTIDIFVLKYGMSMGNFSLATAAGMFKSVVSIVLVLGANTLAKRMGEERLI